MYCYEDYVNNARIIREYIGDFVPEVLIVLGTGLGFIAESVENPISISYRNNSKVYPTSAPGHKARLIFGQYCGKNVCVMQGRLHHYEGYSFEDITFPIRMLKLLGADKLILTNAAGCINTSWSKGDIMIISDHIRLMGSSPLIGPNIDELGPRFPDMGDVYTAEYRRICKSKAAELGIDVREGVYMYFPGPQFETPAEIKAARILGADAAGMSTVPEATVARHCGMKTLALSLMTNMAAGIVKEDLSAADVAGVASDCSQNIIDLIEASLKEM